MHIEFTDGEERINLEGPTEEVEQAQAQMQEIIKDLVREPANVFLAVCFSVVVKMKIEQNKKLEIWLLKKVTSYLITVKFQLWFVLKVSAFVEYKQFRYSPSILFSSLQMARMDYTEINIDQRFHRHLIGKNGANSKFKPFLMC